jgi:hypothetical protein
MAEAEVRDRLVLQKGEEECEEEGGDFLLVLVSNHCSRLPSLLVTLSMQRGRIIVVEE